MRTPIRFLLLGLTLVSVGALASTARALLQTYAYSNFTSVARGASLTFDVTYNGEGVDVTSINSAVGFTPTGCGTMSPVASIPVSITAASPTQVVPTTFTAPASAPLGNCFVTIQNRWFNGTTLLGTRNSNLVFTITAGTPQPPVIFGISETVSTNNFTVYWSTDIAANGRLEWGTAAGNYSGTPVTNLSTYVTTHSLGVSGLSPNTTYYYRITSCSSSGLCQQSPEGSVTTAQASGDTTPPTINPWTYVVGSSQVTFTITTNEPTTLRLDYGQNISYGQNVTDSTLVASHTIQLTGLTPTTVYYYQITATDAAGNSRSTGAVVTNSFTTLAVGEIDRVFTTGACTDGSGNTIAIGQCTTGTPPQYCHSGGVLAPDCNFCGYSCPGTQTCRPDGSCTDNQTFTPSNPYQCNPQSCYDVNGTFKVPASQPCQSNFPRCDANTVLKVRPDRVCSQWLTPLTSVTLTNPLTREREQLSLSLTTCTSLDPSGRCATATSGFHCWNSPLTLCDPNSDNCPAGDTCVPPRHCSNAITTSCNNDSECGVGQCVSDNLTLFTPKDKSALKYLTGSVQAGLSWAGGRCLLNQDRACNQVGDCQTCSNNANQFCRQNADCGAGNTCGFQAGQTCVFDPTYGRCRNDTNRACSLNNALSACGRTCSNDPSVSCTQDSDCGVGNTCAAQCTIQSITGRYPWDLSQQVGVALPQLTNGAFEQFERVENTTTGRTETQFPARPWAAYGQDAVATVIADPSLAGTTTAGSNHVLQITPTTVLDTGAAAPIRGVGGTPNQPYYATLRLRADGPQRVQVTLGTEPGSGVCANNTAQACTVSSQCGAGNACQISTAVYDLTSQWQTKLVRVPNVPGATIKLFLTCIGTPECATTPFYVDDVQIQTSLQVAFQRDQGPTTIVPPSCRMYPREDSLTCDYTNGGVRYLGQHGYCLQRDPNDDTRCVSWWPVDIIAGDGDFYGTQSRVGYSDRSPLYMCAESEGLAALPRVADWGGGPYVVSSNYQHFNPEQDGCNVPALGGTYTFAACRRNGDATPPNFAFSSGRELGLREGDVVSIELVPCADCTNGFAGGPYLRFVGNFDGEVIDTGQRQYRFTREVVANGVDWHVTPLSDCGGDSPGCQENVIQFWVHFRTGTRAGDTETPGLASYTFDLHDRTGSATEMAAYRMLITTRETCNAVVQVVDPANTNAAWTNRIQSRTFTVNGLGYRYATDFAPYGGIVAPPDPANPNTWDGDNSRRGRQPLSAQLPITDTNLDPLATSPYQARAGSPYACVGNCAARVCIGGSRPFSSCTSGDGCGKDSLGTPGVCMGVGSDAVTGASGRGAQAFDVPATGASGNAYYAAQRIRRLFAQSYGVWRWTGQCTAMDTTSFESEGCYQLSSLDPSWSVPTERCVLTSGGANPRDTFDGANNADYCGIPPTVSNIKVNGSSANNPNPLPLNSIVTLSFNFAADAEQAPITQIWVDWDGTGPKAAEPIYKSFANQTDPANPLVFTHVYNQPGTNIQPRIQVKDGWGWCSSTLTGATTLSATCSADPADWNFGPTFTISP